MPCSLLGEFHEIVIGLENIAYGQSFSPAVPPVRTILVPYMPIATFCPRFNVLNYNKTETSVPHASLREPEHCTIMMIIYVAGTH